MKYFVTLIFVLNLSFSFGQVFYQGYNTPDFDNLFENGLAFISTGNEELDVIFENALDENWTVTDYQIYDSENSSNELAQDQIKLVFGVINSGETYENHCLFLISSRYGNSISKYKSIGYMSLNGFNLKHDSEAISVFLEYTIKGLNDGVEIIRSNSIRGKGKALYKRISVQTNLKAKKLKGKTILLIDGVEGVVSHSALEKYNIPYKKITTAEFIELSKEDMSDYALLYFAYYNYTEVSVFDLSDHSLVYTKHYITGGKAKFNYSDVKKLAKAILK